MEYLGFLGRGGLGILVQALDQLARPDELEPPTTWFEARYSFPPFSTPFGRLLYIGVPIETGDMGR